mmetsp:Transcript_82734/g.267923  ORF Transcript_82734/g.267923 Transcript_82734/m.267923 type:complete len:121 (-) Transcript_82734:20-382(-)
MQLCLEYGGGHHGHWEHEGCAEACCRDVAEWHSWDFQRVAAQRRLGQPCRHCDILCGSVRAPSRPDAERGEDEDMVSGSAHSTRSATMGITSATPASVVTSSMVLMQGLEFLCILLNTLQ